MKANEMRDLSFEELDRKLLDLKQEMFNLRFQHASGQLENPRKLGQTRKAIARAKTIIRQTQLKGKKE
jgi:large subunit ribosomal protein L29